MEKSVFWRNFFVSISGFMVKLRAVREKSLLGTRIPRVEIVGVLKEPQYYLISAKLPGKVRPLEFTFEKNGEFVYHSSAGEFLLDPPMQKILHNKFVRYIKHGSPYFGA